MPYTGTSNLYLKLGARYFTVILSTTSMFHTTLCIYDKFHNLEKSLWRGPQRNKPLFAKLLFHHLGAGTLKTNKPLKSSFISDLGRWFEKSKVFIYLRQMGYQFPTGENGKSKQKSYCFLL